MFAFVEIYVANRTLISYVARAKCHIMNGWRVVHKVSTEVRTKVRAIFIYTQKVQHCAVIAASVSVPELRLRKASRPITFHV
jgi:hypothetical protein